MKFLSPTVTATLLPWLNGDFVNREITPCCVSGPYIGDAGPRTNSTLSTSESSGAKN